MKNKSHMIISTNAQKAFDKIQHLFMQKKKKTFNKVCIEETYLNKIKAILDKPQLTSYSIAKAKKLPRIY